MFKDLVIQYKLITVEYFMDTLQPWEALELYDVLGYADYAIWEQTRLLYSTQIDHKKCRNLTDVMKFAWDDRTDDDYDELTEEQKSVFRKQQRELLKKMMLSNNG